MPAQIRTISENECIGDSLEQMNKNFAALKVLVDEFKIMNFSTLEGIQQGLFFIQQFLNQQPD